MQITSGPEFDRAAIRLAESIARQGGRLYLVGGCVRDQVVGREPHDFDLCVTGLTEEAVRGILPEARVSGQRFPVFRAAVGNKVCEIALARTERKTGEGRRGFDVWAGVDVSIEDDLRRRDFTINAMAFDLLAGEIIDPFGGQRDIKTGTLRAVSEAFGEDPLRVYRAARFAATLGFEVERGTVEAMRQLVPELGSLSTERVVLEFWAAMWSQRPSRFFETLAAAGALSVHFKEIADLQGVLQPVEHHPEGDAFEHSMQVLDEAAGQSEAAAVRFAALVHDLGKAATPKEEWPWHQGHDARGVPLVAALGKRLGLAHSIVRAGQIAAKRHMILHHVGWLRGVTMVDILKEAERSALGVEGLVIVVDADSRGRGAAGRPSPSVPEILKADAARRAVRSEEIKAPAGAKFGAALRAAQGAAVAAAIR